MKNTESAQIGNLKKIIEKKTIENDRLRQTRDVLANNVKMLWKEIHTREKKLNILRKKIKDETRKYRSIVKEINNLLSLKIK